VRSTAACEGEEKTWADGRKEGRKAGRPAGRREEISAVRSLLLAYPTCVSVFVPPLVTSLPLLLSTTSSPSLRFVTTTMAATTRTAADKEEGY
jgi:hypothetical protein